MVGSSVTDPSPGQSSTPAEEQTMTKRTVLSALGTASLLLSTVVAVAPAADAAPKMHAKRVCSASRTATVASCSAKVLVDVAGVVPHTATPSASAKTPAQLRSAYGLDAASSGRRTVAIVDAYGYPNLARDLATYRSQFNLPSCPTATGCLKIVDQNGGT